ncbi:hypothetical protein ACIBCA_28230 [Kitasatospora sp. NPDC051170]|uniref:hypothetical protein n=1 Tax=Kitasatospora sp. NPDC051170 TaxID=3364056 RepID=UPI0037BC324D
MLKVLGWIVLALGWIGLAVVSRGKMFAWKQWTNGQRVGALVCAAVIVTGFALKA